MSLSVAPRLSELSSAISDRLTQWAQANERQGTVKQVANSRHLWEEVSNPALVSEKPRILFVFTGQKSRGSFQHANTLHRCDNTWQVVVVRGHGWENLVSNGGAGQPESFLDAMEDLRDYLRCYGDITTEPPIDFTSMGPMPNIMPGSNVSNIFADAFQITFSTANDIPFIDFTPQT